MTSLTFSGREIHGDGQGTLMVLHNPLLPNVSPVVFSLSWGHQHLKNQFYVYNHPLSNIKQLFSSLLNYQLLNILFCI